MPSLHAKDTVSNPVGRLVQAFEQVLVIHACHFSRAVWPKGDHRTAAGYIALRLRLHCAHSKNLSAERSKQAIIVGAKDELKCFELENNVRSVSQSATLHAMHSLFCSANVDVTVMKCMDELGARAASIEAYLVVCWNSNVNMRQGRVCVTKCNGGYVHVR